MVHMGLGLLFTEGQPLIGMMISTALGGVDTYIRYDLFPSPKYELSLGMATVATYSLLGASDITVASGASMRASYSTKKGAKIFVESSLPIYGLEYTDSCIQASEGGWNGNRECIGAWFTAVQQRQQFHIWVVDHHKNRNGNAFLTKISCLWSKPREKWKPKGCVMASSVVFFSSC